VKGSADQEKWKPCLEGLRQEIKEIELASLEQQTLSETLSRYGVNRLFSLNQEPDPLDGASKAGFKTVLQSEIVRLQLVECRDRGKFCLDMALHARLWDLDSGRYTYNKVFVYTGDPVSSPSYEIRAWPDPLCRKMDLYCNAEARETFRREITSGLQQIAEMISDDVAAHTEDITAH
jgi:hypothetical protein